MFSRQKKVFSSRRGLFFTVKGPRKEGSSWGGVGSGRVWRGLSKKGGEGPRGCLQEIWGEASFTMKQGPFSMKRPQNPLFAQFKGGGTCFRKRALRQSRPSKRFVPLPFPNHKKALSGPESPATICGWSLRFVWNFIVKRVANRRKAYRGTIRSEKKKQTA